MIRAFLEFHGVFGIPPAAKWDQPATTWMSPAHRRWCGKAGTNGLAGGVLWNGFPFLLADWSPVTPFSP